VGLATKRSRLEILAREDRQPITVFELDSIKAKERGQREKVGKLSQAVAELKERMTAFPVDDESAQDRIAPHSRRIEALQAQLQRLQEMLLLGEVRAPENGRILKVGRFTGEFSEPGASILELLVDGSLQPTLYVEQSAAPRFAPGRVLDVRITPNSQLTRCEVIRLGDQLEPPPKNIELYYRQDVRLVPVHLRPLAAGQDGPQLKLGAEVCLPTSWWRRSRATETVRRVPVTRSDPSPIPSQRGMQLQTITKDER
jgi:hypothetical protein